MKKQLFFLAAMAIFAACSSSDDLAVKDQPQVKAESGAVGFDAYLNRATTRAGSTGTLLASGATTGIQTNLWEGFGVFAYYTDNNEYDAQTLPNFMYNQKVYKTAGDATYWTYTPIMYWPNEYGQNAISDDNDKVSFFAYAPYVDFNPATGKIRTIADGNDQWGIVQASRNSATGDPWVKYIASFDGSKQVDLCWGVNETAEWNTVNSGIQSFSTGFPWLNVQRPREAITQTAVTSSSQQVKFQFKHALSQLLVTVDTYADADAAAAVQEDAKSHVFVRSITFSGFATKGMLNLNNTESNKALWLDFNGNGDLEAGQEVTVTDGRRDGKEGTSGGALPNEKGIGLNPDIVETEANYDYSKTPTEFTGNGVDATARNVFRKWDKTNNKYVAMANTDPIYVIPTGEEVQVTIVYDVETIDPNLPVYLADNKTTGSCIENRITKTVNFGKLGMENGKKYTIKLHLGLNSVKFDADVTGWDDGGTKDIDLPSNVTTFAAAAGASYDFVLNAAATPQTFKLTGFNGGENVQQTKVDGTKSISFTAPSSFPVTNLNANPSGEVNGTFTPSANETVWDKDCKIKWTGTVSGKQVELSLTQLAKALGLSISAVSSGSGEITLNSTASITWTTDVVNPATDITVYRNGVKLEYHATPTAGHFGWNASSNKIILPTTEAATKDEVFTITVKAGNAPAETKSVTVGA